MYKKIWIIVISVILIHAISGSILAKKTENFTWNPKEGVIITVTGNRVEGYKKFVEEIRKVLPDVCRWGSRFLIDFTKNEGELASIRNAHTIFMIRQENLEQLKNLEAEHPNLLPLPYSELKSYSFPLLYFSRGDDKKIRGIIIADVVTPLLAKLLTEKALPLDVPFRYENGQLREIKEE